MRPINAPPELPPGPGELTTLTRVAGNPFLHFHSPSLIILQLRSTMSDSIAKAWSEGFPGIREMQQKLAHGKGFIHRRLPGDALTRCASLGSALASGVATRALTSSSDSYICYTGAGRANGAARWPLAGGQLAAVGGVAGPTFLSSNTRANYLRALWWYQRWKDQLPTAGATTVAAHVTCSRGGQQCLLICGPANEQLCNLLHNVAVSS